MQQILVALIMILVTVLLYFCMIQLYRRLPIPILLPILTTTILILVLLKSINLSYEDYMIGGSWLELLLGPAVVAFAYPLYQQRKKVIENALPIVGGVLIGLLVGMVSVIFLAELLSLPKELILSLIPKSITTPVAMGVSEEIGGIPSLTVAFVMLSGISGAIFGPFVLKKFGIQNSLGTGVSLGNASHAIGTSKAFEFGEFHAAMSTVSMILSATIGPLIGFLVVKFFIL